MTVAHGRAWHPFPHSHSPPPHPSIACPQVIQVWDQIIHYSECTDEELHDVVLILLELMDGTSDVMVPVKTGTSLGLLSHFHAAAPEANRYEFSESNLYIMECKLAVCKLLLVMLDLLAAEELDKIIYNFFGADLADHEELTGAMLASLRESNNNAFFVALRERLLPILRQTLLYQHNGLVATALSLLFRLSMLRSETTALLQETQLLHSPEMVRFYRRACRHAVRLQSFFNNKSNLRGQWCETMLKELQWFMNEVAAGHSLVKMVKHASDRMVACRSLHYIARRFERKSRSLGASAGSMGEIQALLRTLKLHQIAINILEALEGMRDQGAAAKMAPPLYDFLVAFCARNPRNQLALHHTKGMDVIVRALPENQGADRLLFTMFDGNYELCARNNLYIIEDLIQILGDPLTATQSCFRCLQVFVVHK